MGGTAIPGSHWVILDFSALVLSAKNGNDNPIINGGAMFVTNITLDWETAYAKDYRIEGRLTPPPLPVEKSDGGLRKEAKDDGEWCVLYDGALDDDNGSKHNNHNFPRRSVQEYGQSPGVKRKMPLHIIHTIDWTEILDNDANDVSGEKNEHGSTTSEEYVEKNCHILQYLRIFIRKPARGWGVSLWEVDVHGIIMS